MTRVRHVLPPVYNYGHAYQPFFGTFGQYLKVFGVFYLFILYRTLKINLNLLILIADC